MSQCLSSHAGVVSKWLNVSNWLSARRLPSTSRRLILRYLVKGIRLSPNIRVLLSGTLSQTLNVAFLAGRRPSQVFADFVATLIALRVHLCLQHVGHDAVRRCGWPATAETCIRLPA